LKVIGLIGRQMVPPGAAARYDPLRVLKEDHRRHVGRGPGRSSQVRPAEGIESFLKECTTEMVFLQQPGTTR